MTRIGQFPSLYVGTSKQHGGQIGNADITAVRMSDIGQKRAERWPTWP